MKKTNRILALLLCALLCVAALSACGGGGNGSPEAVISAMQNYLNNADFEGMANLVQPSQRDAYMTQLQSSVESSGMTMAQLKEMYKSFGYKTTMKVVNTETVSEDHVICTVEMTMEVMGMSNTDTSDIDIYKVDGAWYIDSNSAAGAGTI